MDAGQDGVRVGRLADGGGGEGEYVLAALVLGGLERLADDVDEAVDAGLADRAAILFQEFGQPQIRLVGVGGQRARAGVRVHHQQMDGIRTHIEDTESHGRNATAGPHGA